MTSLARNVSSLVLHKKKRRNKHKTKHLFSLKKEKLGILRYKVTAWRIPLTEEPGRLQSHGQRSLVGYIQFMGSQNQLK